MNRVGFHIILEIDGGTFFLTGANRLHQLITGSGDSLMLLLGLHRIVVEIDHIFQQDTQML